MAMNAGTDCTGVRMPVGSPMPTHCTARMSSANAGSARPMLAMLTAIAPPVRTWPSRMPIGSATSAATSTDTIGELHVLAEQVRDRLVAVPLVVVGEEVEDVAEEVHRSTGGR